MYHNKVQGQLVPNLSTLIASRANKEGTHVNSQKDQNYPVLLPIIMGACIHLYTK